MIVKMKFLSITGPQADIDRAVSKYLSKYEMHLENTMTELQTVHELRPYIEINPYRQTLTKAQGFLELIEAKDESPTRKLGLQESIGIIEDLSSLNASLEKEKVALGEQRDALKQSLRAIAPFRELKYDLHAVLDFKFVKYRFGKISHEYWNKLETYVYDNLDTLFYKCYSNDEYIWGVYFVPAEQSSKIDAVYSSLHFERLHIPDEYEGTPEEAYQKLSGQIKILDFEIQTLEDKLIASLTEKKEELIAAAHILELESSIFDVRKLAACTKKKDHNFYILCGWMSESDAKSFCKEIEHDDNLFVIIEDDHNNIYSTPPTKLKNPKIFRPFEMFIRMYGIPSYNEIDPTIFVALTYAFIFGVMFGDVGQGICLAVGGFLLYHFKKINLAAIVGTAGIFSTFFGFMFGSIFGFEDIIDAVWLRPVSQMSNVPFVGKLNTIFIVAIAFGMFLILVTMVLHIINGIKARDTENIFFDTNGLAGLVFYGSITLILVLFMTGNPLPAGIVVALMFILPLLVVGLREPLTALVEKRADKMPKEKGMFIVQTFFELFETLLSYFSNTLSFVRIGAFAVSHAAMMEVVLMLAGAESGSPNWIVVVLGNIFVCGMEGLIVGIQVLRLEYYEMFSRFYKGNGHEFKPFISKSFTKSTKESKQL